MATTGAQIASPPAAAITQILPYISQGASLFSSSLRAVARSLVFLVSKALRPIFILSPVPLVLYILAPVIVFLELFFDALVLTPYRLSVFFLDALYPIYVFCGVACIIGALVGFGGRIIATKLVEFVSGVSSEPSLATAESKGRVKTKEESIYS